MGYLQLTASIDYAKRVANSYQFRETAGALETLATRVGAYTTHKDCLGTYLTWLDKDQRDVRATFSSEFDSRRSEAIKAIDRCEENNSTPKTIRQIVLASAYSSKEPAITTIKESEWNAAKDVGKWRNRAAIGIGLCFCAGYLLHSTFEFLGGIFMIGALASSAIFAVIVQRYDKQLKLLTMVPAERYLKRLDETINSIRKSIEPMEKQLKAWIHEIRIPMDVEAITAEIEKEN